MNEQDIHEVRALFEDAEGETDPAGKMDALVEALALVDRIVDDAEVLESIKAIARNIRRSHLRKLLYQLFAMRDVDFPEWFGYMRVLLVDHQVVITDILAGDDSLKDGYEGFMALWGNEFGKALERGPEGV